jgi:hypothetical protein
MVVSSPCIILPVMYSNVWYILVGRRIKSVLIVTSRQKGNKERKKERKNSDYYGARNNMYHGNKLWRLLVSF